MTAEGTFLRQVAKAICKSRSCEGVSCCQWPAQGGRTKDKCPVEAGGYDDAAQDAIMIVQRMQAEEQEARLKGAEARGMLFRNPAVNAAAPTGLVGVVHGIASTKEGKANG